MPFTLLIVVRNLSQESSYTGLVSFFFFFFFFSFLFCYYGSPKESSIFFPHRGLWYSRGIYFLECIPYRAEWKLIIIIITSAALFVDEWPDHRLSLPRYLEHIRGS